MARVKRSKHVGDYRHSSKRLNNPPVGLAVHEDDGMAQHQFELDPHLDPQLRWSGKDVGQSFTISTPSIHIHERLSTQAIIQAVQKQQPQLSIFEDSDLDRTKAVEFYQHEMGWVNRLILGDCLVGMTSLLEKERLAGRVQTIYMDPPYGIGYNSNFQPRISNRMVKDGSDAHLTREPEQIQAFRDTWTLGIHSYLTYLQRRLPVCRELLADAGSIFVQIGEDNVHLVRALLDEAFGRENFCSLIAFRTKIPLRTTLLPGLYDYIAWYAKDKSRVHEKFRRIFTQREVGEGSQFTWVELGDGTRRKMTREERMNPLLLPKDSRPFRLTDLVSSGRTESCVFEFELGGRVFSPTGNKSWKTNREGMRRLIEKNRVMVAGATPGYVFFAEDYPVQELSNVWTDTQGPTNPSYVVQTSTKIIERCILMTTDPGDLVLDPMVGSGTSSYVAEQWGRRWIGIDTSRVAIALARERILTATYPYYRLQDETRGVDGGLQYRSVSHVTLGSVAQDRPPAAETLYDRPDVDVSKVRVSGPFTVEALSRYSVNPLSSPGPLAEDAAYEAADHARQLLAALKSHGIPRRGTKPLAIASLEPLASVGPLQAEGDFETNGIRKRFAVSIGPRFGSITSGQVDEALGEAYGYDLVVFVGFAAHAEAQAMLAKGRRGRFEVALLMANPDLLVGDLLKHTAASQTFRLFASPDVHIETTKGQVTVVLVGVDSYDAATGKVSSVNRGEVAAWFLDQDYDGMVFHVSQAFFPKENAWELLEKTLDGLVDASRMKQLQSFESLSFKASAGQKIAIRVITDDGNASESILSVER